MLSRFASVMAGMLAATRGTDNRRLDVRRVLDRRRHRQSFDDLARDSRLEHQKRADGRSARRVRNPLRHRVLAGRPTTTRATDTVGGDR
jgi:hypothetical protein